MNEKTQNVPTVQDDDEITIDVLDLLRQLLIQWKVILICMILCGGAAFTYCRFFAIPLYSSTSGLYVFSKSTSVTSLADLQIGSSLTNDYETVIIGRPVLDRVIVRLKLDENYESLRSKIAITNPRDSRILYITVTDPDPQRAKEIADRTASIAATFISQKMDQDPPSIIQTGYTDGAPVSPRTKRTTVIGLLIGFLAAAAFIVIHHLQNDTIRTPEDIQEILGLNVLASLPLESSDIKNNRNNKKQQTSGHRHVRRKAS
jgi:capsular polysaccharide biosynthesis protein